MKTCSIQVLCDAMGGRLVAGSGEPLIEGGVSTDTRTMPEGALFFALAGENFDAHDFLAKAVEEGAGGLVVSRVPEGLDPGSAAVVEVADTLIALQRLARWYRSQLDVVVVGITGSNGKTTTKDFVEAVLEQRYQVHATKGNFNNHIGLPLTILCANEDDDVLILEMGMNHPGEIAPLCAIAQPQIGIITNIGTAHIEFMGSREAIAEEKGALARSLPEVGTLLVTAGCDFTEYFQARTHARTIAVGNGRGLVRAESLRLTKEGSEFELAIDGAGGAFVKLRLPGKHMANNALLAAGVGWALGLTPDELACGLEAASITGGRLRCFQRDGITIFDDTYNSSPESVRVAIDVVAEQATRNGNTRTVVLGVMAELGRFAEELHHQVGEHAAAQGVRVVSVGRDAVKIAEGARDGGANAVEHFDNYDEAAAWLQETLHAGDVVLFKGSRTAAVEKIMNKVFPEG